MIFAQAYSLQEESLLWFCAVGTLIASKIPILYISTLDSLARLETDESNKIILLLSDAVVRKSSELSNDITYIKLRYILFAL